ncbi:MAG: hypothetical protein JKY53_03130 [Flavobacteriales bacterium]|nr:hypothetical protein [Flavobacteriales bacterium]
MKPFTLYFALLFAAPVVVAQSAYTLQAYDSDSSKIVVGVSGEIQYNSSAITNEFAKTFYQGDYLTNEIKQSSLGRMTNFNRLGLDVNYGVYTSLRLGKFLGRNPYRLNWFIGIYDRSHTNLSIPKSLFELIFEGNKQFAGQAIGIGGFNFNLYQYQQVQTGLLYDNGLGQVFAISASYLNGNKYISYDVPQLSFYTSEIGDEIAVDWELQYKQSDLENSGYATSNGSGFSTDLMYQFSYDSSTEIDNYFKIELNDLGFITWSSNSKTITSSDSISYNGYYIKDVQEISDSIIRNLSTDSIIDSYSYSNTGKFTTYLPARISINIYQQHSEKLAMNLGMSYRINANYTPYLFFEEHFYITSSIDIAGRLSYGGYSKLSYGINIRAKLKTIALFLGTNNIEGLMAPTNFGGFSVFGGLNIRM